MTAKQWIIDETRKMAENLFRSAKAMPEDKLTWKPLELGRSALDQCQECAQSAQWGVALLTKRAMPEFTPELMEQVRAERAAWSLEDCERICAEHCEALFQVIRDFPEDDMEKTMFLPFGQGREWSFAELMGLQLWNLTYHVGQIAYIQTLYGDKDFH